jgi:hypothetical protein
MKTFHKALFYRKSTVRPFPFHRGQKEGEILSNNLIHAGVSSQCSSNGLGSLGDTEQSESSVLKILDI